MDGSPDTPDGALVELLKMRVEWIVRLHRYYKKYQLHFWCTCEGEWIAWGEACGAQRVDFRAPDPFALAAQLSQMDKRQLGKLLRPLPRGQVQAVRPSKHYRALGTSTGHPPQAAPTRHQRRTR